MTNTSKLNLTNSTSGINVSEESNISKILIVRLSSIGDVIHSLPILHSLKRKFANAQIDWIVEDRAADLLVNNPLISNVYVIPKQKWKKRGFSFRNCKEFLNIIHSIKKENYDIAIDLQELFKSGIITYLSGAKRRIAHSKTREFADLFVNEKIEHHNIFDPNKMIIERYLEPAAYLGAPVDEVKFVLPPITDEIKVKVDNLLQNIDSTKPTIALIPGTIWPSKHWIESYWSTLLTSIAHKNNIIFIGSNNEISLIERIASKSAISNYISLAGTTSLLDLAEVFNRCNIVISTDTGPMHIANASNIPTIISIFGSTSYKRSCPYGEKHIALSSKLNCQPCFNRKCKKKDDFMNCMKFITPEMVADKINKCINL